VACSDPLENGSQSVTQPVDLVNPYMGNISHLLVPTFPTVHLPNSMMRMTPDRGDYTEVSIHGLSLLLTSHRGSKAFSMSPFQGDETDLKPVIDFSYDQEKVTPYSYSVYLDELQIQVDFGLSFQSAAYTLQFEQEAPAYLILNSSEGRMNWDGQAITAYKQLQNDTRAYLYLVPEVLPQKVSSLKDGALNETSGSDGKNANLVLTYPKGTSKLNVRYGISFIDEAQAQKNMEREVAKLSVAQLQSAGRDIWNKALGKINIKGGTEDQQTVFYTSLYHFY
jgi:predicted alpha-1,2-mannosidase